VVGNVGCRAGVATRRHARVGEPVGKAVQATSKSTSRSAVSRRFVKETETALDDLLAAPLADLDIKVLMIDGVHMGEHCMVVALGIGADGTKTPLGLWEGATENTAVVKSLLTDLVDRGLSAEDGLLEDSEDPSEIAVARIKQATFKPGSTVSVAHACLKR